MRRVHVIAALTVAMLSVHSAWAQYGLYGAPDLLRLPPIQQTSAEQAGQYAQAHAQLPPAQAWQGRMPRPQNTSAALAPGYLGYAEQVPQPVIGRRVGPAPRIRSVAGTYLGPAPVDNAQGQPAQRAPEQIPHPQPGLGPSVGNEMVSQMLQESGCFEPNPWTEQPTGAECCPAECEPCAPPCCLPWFGGVSGLIMGRDAPNRLWTTYSTADQTVQLMHTDIDLNWEAGAEITFGRRFCCDRWAVAVTYWSLNAFSSYASQTAAGGVSTPLDFTDVIYADAALDAAGFVPVTLFDNSQEHRLWRTNEIHNVEINVIRNHFDFYPGDFTTGNPVEVDWMIGARFFRFEEDLRFGSLEAGAFTWAADPDRQGYLEDRCKNSLVGAQIGANVDYTVRPGWRIFVRPKIGIYNNHIENSFMAYRGDGELFAPDPTPTPPPVRSAVPGSYPVNANTDVISFLTEVNLGLDWQFLPNWTFTAGYRVMMATGMGLADNQFTHYVVDIPELADIDHNGQLILHGVFSGIEFNY